MNLVDFELGRIFEVLSVLWLSFRVEVEDEFRGLKLEVLQKEMNRLSAP